MHLPTDPPQTAILLSANIPLPKHLQDPKYRRDIPDTQSAAANDTPVLGQPDDREAEVGLEQFYDSDAWNGCKPLALAQFVSALIRVNPDLDQKPIVFASTVADYR